MSRDASLNPDPNGFLNYSEALQAGADLSSEAFTSLENAEKWCAANSSCAGFTFDTNVSDPNRRVFFKSGIVLGGGRGQWSSYVKASRALPGTNTQQVWVKRLGPLGSTGGAPMAVLCVNAGPTNSSANFTVSLEELGITSTHGASVQDIWNATNTFPKIQVGGRFHVRGVLGHSSRFFRISPVE
eukprot:COSAG02_NODE_194_length_29788_cov_20.044090_22_plen_185_part_00